MNAWPTLVAGLGVVAGIYVLICAVMWLAQPYLLYQPDFAGDLDHTPDDVGLAYDRVTIETRDGLRLAGWYVHGPEDAAPVVLFFHGNAGHMAHRLQTLELLHAAGAATLIVDYRGYGDSEGTPSEQGTSTDARAAWRWLTRERGIAPERIVVFGRSLGAAIAARLASEVEPAGVALEAAFTSVPDMAAELYPWLPARWLTRYHYATIDHLDAVRCPIFIAHARGDEIVPYAHGQRLSRRHGDRTTFHTLEGGHNTAFIESQPAYRGALAAFFERTVVRTDARSERD